MPFENGEYAAVTLLSDKPNFSAKSIISGLLNSLPLSCINLPGIPGPIPLPSTQQSRIPFMID